MPDHGQVNLVKYKQFLWIAEKIILDDCILVCIFVENSPGFVRLFSNDTSI